MMRHRGWPIFQSMQLMMEAQQVIALRMMKMAAGGPGAIAEANRMVSEKTEAVAEAATLAHNPQAVVHMLRKKVRANRRRLTSGS